MCAISAVISSCLRLRKFCCDCKKILLFFIVSCFCINHTYFFALACILVVFICLEVSCNVATTNNWVNVNHFPLCYSRCLKDCEHLCPTNSSTTVKTKTLDPGTVSVTPVPWYFTGLLESENDRERKKNKREMFCCFKQVPIDKLQSVWKIFIVSCQK